MKNLPYILFTFLIATTPTFSQNKLEIDGKAKITEMDKDNTADSVVVRLPDGTLAIRDVSTLHEYQVLSISHDTVYLTNGGYVKLPDADSTNELQQISIQSDTIFISNSNFIVLPGLRNILKLASVQERLDGGHSPCEIFQDDIPIDSLYSKNYQGGLIFYLDTINCNGLVSAPNDDQSVAIQWYNGEFIPIPGGTPYAIGSGASNTDSIVLAQGLPTSSERYAAYICDTLNLNGYSDWFLPSRDELFEMFLKLKINGFGNFDNGYYWSSSQNSYNTAYWLIMFSGTTGTAMKDESYRVRAIRAF